MMGHFILTCVNAVLYILELYSGFEVTIEPVFLEQ
jgi:hypothetical protein